MSKDYRCFTTTAGLQFLEYLADFQFNRLDAHLEDHGDFSVTLSNGNPGNHSALPDSEVFNSNDAASGEILCPIGKRQLRFVALFCHNDSEFTPSHAGFRQV